MGSGYEWNLDGDAKFLSEMIATLSQQFPGVHPRVCVTGMSGGARMSSLFASSHPDQVLLLGAVAGLRAPARPNIGQPVRVVAFHGTADRINPFAGGTTSRWYESVPDAAKAWAAAEGRHTGPHVDEVSSTLTRYSFGADDEPGAVTLWVSKGAGHTWPGTRLPLLLRLYLGRTSQEVDATAEIWRAVEALGAG